MAIAFTPPPPDWGITPGPHPGLVWRRPRKLVLDGRGGEGAGGWSLSKIGRLPPLSTPGRHMNWGIAVARKEREGSPGAADAGPC